jgi:hypothetical protein
VYDSELHPFASVTLKVYPGNKLGKSAATDDPVVVIGPKFEAAVADVVPVIKNVKAPTPLLAVTDTVVVAVHVTAALENVKSVGEFKGCNVMVERATSNHSHPLL